MKWYHSCSQCKSTNYVMTIDQYGTVYATCQTCGTTEVTAMKKPQKP